jgi:regulator of replication initiation timing
MFFKNLDREFAKEQALLKEAIDKLKRENESLKLENAALNNAIDSELSKAAFSVDWKTMNAFSIERVREHDTHKTIIGYMVSEPFETTQDGVYCNDSVREWSLSCSLAEHQRLVDEFNQYRGEK